MCREANVGIATAREDDGSLRAGTVVIIPPASWKGHDVGDEEEMVGMSTHDQE